jgi:hypothetical protein
MAKLAALAALLEPSTKPHVTCSYGDFLNLYGGGQANSIFTTGITVPQPH